MLDVVFEFENLRVTRDPVTRQATFARIDRRLRGQISAYLPGQHLAETVFFVSQSQTDELALPPINTRLSEPSRLVFEVVGDNELPFSIDTLLGWNDFGDRLTPSPVATSQIRRPNESETSIEAPYGLLVSPIKEYPHRWQHASRVTSQKGFVEVWHTSLLGAPSRTNSTGYEPARIAAVYSRDSDPPIGRMPIAASDRRRIVELTHDANGSFAPIVARSLVLSTVGATLNYDGSFSYDCKANQSIAGYRHISVGGQSNFDLLQKRGYLYPFGHRVSLLSITTREIAPVPLAAGGPQVQGAYLRQRLLIDVSETRKSYEGDANAEELMFRSIEIDTDSSPPLDEPNSLEISIERSARPGESYGQRAFWPTTGGRPFLFPLIGEDWNGKLIQFTAPVVFVEHGAAAPDDNTIAQDNHEYFQRLLDVQKAYRISGRRLRPIDATEVAVAPARTNLDTTVDVLQVEFDGSVQSRPICPGPDSLFSLSVRRIEARIPTLRDLLTDELNRAWFEPRNPLTTKSELYLLAVPAPDSDQVQPIILNGAGQSERTGGFSAISMMCAGLSRIYGVVGSRTRPTALKFSASSNTFASPIEQDRFDPGDYLDDNATLFGSIKLADIIENGLSVEDAQMPSIISQIVPYSDVPEKLRRRINWQTEQIRSWPSSSSPVFASQQRSADCVPDRLTPTSFSLTAEASLFLDSNPRPQATVFASLSNFGIRLADKSNNGVLIRCREFTYSLDQSGRTNVSLKIQSVELLGEALAFVATITELLGDAFGNSGVSIHLMPAGVEIRLPSFNWPALTFGAFSLRNLSISSSVQISFRSEPVLYRFNFSSPESPFLVAVGVYGGAGSVEIILDTRRVVRLLISIAYGAFGAFKVGPANGSASVLCGLIYRSESKTGLATAASPSSSNSDVYATDITYDFYVHAYGSVNALGFITVSVDFYLVMRIHDGKPSYSEGRVKVTYNVKIGFFRRSFSLEFYRQFSGSTPRTSAVPFSLDHGPTMAATNALSLSQWKRYRRAFEPRGAVCG